MIAIAYTLDSGRGVPYHKGANDELKWFHAADAVIAADLALRVREAHGDVTQMEAYHLRCDLWMKAADLRGRSVLVKGDFTRARDAGTFDLPGGVRAPYAGANTLNVALLHDFSSELQSRKMALLDVEERCNPPREYEEEPPRAAPSAHPARRP